MELKFLVSVIGISPMISAFFYLLRRKKSFQSVFPFGFAAFFIFVARIVDVPMENRNFHVAQWFGYADASFSSSVTLVGNIADGIGILFLVLGFVRAIESLRLGVKKIETLECSPCVPGARGSERNKGSGSQ